MTKTIALSASSTNATFYDALCNNGPLSAYDIVSVSTSGNLFYEIPSCLATATSIKEINIDHMFVPTFAVLPNTLTLLNCITCKFGPNAATPSTSPTIATPYSASTSTDFDPSGNVVWDQVWLILPNLEWLTLGNGDLKGNLPASIPPKLLRFNLNGNMYLSGTIPPSLFSQFEGGTGAISAISVSFEVCSLSGQLPADLFAPFNGRALGGFFFDVQSNAITGSIPANFLTPLQSAATVSFAVLLANNQLSGPLPPNLFPSGLLSTVTGPYFMFDVSKNKLEGTLPEGFLSTLVRIQTLIFSVNQNLLSGQLPAALFGGDTWTSVALSLFTLNLAQNSFTGTIPPTLLTSSLQATNFTFSDIVTINLGGNRLTGSIPNLFSSESRILKKDATGTNRDALSPENGLSSFDGDDSSVIQTRSSAASYFLATLSAITLKLDLSDNLLTGTLPSNLLDFTALASSRLTMLLDHNQLSGTFPDTFSSVFPNPSDPSLASLIISAANNRFTGNAPTSCNGVREVSHNLHGNRLNGSISQVDLSCSKLTLNVSMNIKPIPAGLFDRPTLNLYASYTNLSGTIPTSMASSAASIDLSFTNIDFCTAPLIPSTAFYSPATCKLDATSAACACPSNYSACSLVCNAPMIPITPYSDNEPSSPPAYLPPTGCDLRTRPSPEFECINNVWVAISTTSPILTIPSGAGVIIVEGNVTSSTIIINGIGTAIMIGGCASNLSSVVIELSPEQVKQLESTKSLQTLLTLSNDSVSCSMDLNGVTLNTKSSGCRKVKTEKVVSGNTLGAYFTVNSSGCNTWWIVLVAVITGVVVIAVIIAVVSIVSLQRRRHQREKGHLGHIDE